MTAGFDAVTIQASNKKERDKKTTPNNIQQSPTIKKRLPKGQRIAMVGKHCLLD